MQIYLEGNYGKPKPDAREHSLFRKHKHLPWERADGITLSLVRVEPSEGLSAIYLEFIGSVPLYYTKHYGNLQSDEKRTLKDNLDFIKTSWSRLVSAQFPIIWL